MKVVMTIPEQTLHWIQSCTCLVQQKSYSYSSFHNLTETCKVFEQLTPTFHCQSDEEVCQIQHKFFPLGLHREGEMRTICHTLHHQASHCEQREQKQLQQTTPGACHSCYCPDHLTGVKHSGQSCLWGSPSKSKWKDNKNLPDGQGKNRLQAQRKNEMNKQIILKTKHKTRSLWSSTGSQFWCCDK